MFSRVLGLLAAFAISLQLTFGLHATHVDNVVIYCQDKVRSIQATEGRYIRGKRKVGEPVLQGPPLKELLDIQYAINQRQRVFECIGDMLHGSSQQSLEISQVYTTFVRKCISERPVTPHCDSSYPYRTINGTCNNILHPNWGSTLHCFRRLYPANYESVSGLRKSVKGKRPLPMPRTVSLNIVKPCSRPTTDYNALFVFFGQAVAHDLGEYLHPSTEDGKVLDCCPYARTKHQYPECMPTLLPPDDPFYSKQNISCLHNDRMVACPSCSVDKRDHVNHVTSYLDCSIVYTQANERAKHVRSNDGTGKLKTQRLESGELLPVEENQELAHRCTRKNGSPRQGKQYCFEKADDRGNQHAIIQMLQTIFLREHNRLAEKLKILNPHWDEEKLYQEARKILIAKFQVIVYKEFLPLLLGNKLMTKYGLDLGGGSKYDFTMDASLSAEFNAAAFRLHSLIPGKVVDDEEFEYLRHLFVNAVPLYENRIHSFASKMSSMPAEKYDWCLPTDVTHFLFRQDFGTYAFDLAALDIQRGRDVGLPTYPQVIEYMEKRPGTIRKFDDLKEYLVPECQRLLKETYFDVRDIDLWMGLNCERIPDDMIISPTAAEIIAEQFKRSKYGDRFFIEHDHHLTDAQRKTLFDASLSKLICDNSHVSTIQPMVMLFPSIENIPRICSEIHGVDLEKWKD